MGYHEEEKLIKEISKGLDIDDISKLHNRSYNAIELRIKKIIYDNLSINNSSNKVDKLAKLFKLSKDTINQFYKDYKHFIDRKQTEKEKTENKTENNKTEPASKKMDSLNKLKEQNDKLKIIIDNIRLKEEFNILLKKKKNKNMIENISKLII